MGARQPAAPQRATSRAHPAKRRQQKQQRAPRQQKQPQLSPQPPHANQALPTGAPQPSKPSTKRVQREPLPTPVVVDEKQQRQEPATVDAVDAAEAVDADKEQRQKPEQLQRKRPTLATMAALATAPQPIPQEPPPTKSASASTPGAPTRRPRAETHPIAALHAIQKLPIRRNDDPAQRDAPRLDANAQRAFTPRTSEHLNNLNNLDDPSDQRSAKSDIHEPSPVSSFSSLPLRTYTRAHSPSSRGLIGRYGRTERRGMFSLPAVDWIVPVALFHAAVAAGAALTAAALIVTIPSLSGWALSLAALAGLGAALAYLASQAKKTALAALWLLFSALGMLAWALVAFGPRLALLAALAPGYIALALRARGRTSAALTTLAALGCYALALVAAFSGWLHPPIVLNALGIATLDGGGAATGLVITLMTLLNWHASNARAHATAQASQHEAAFLRQRAAQTREHTEHDTDYLARALGHAIQGRGIPPVHVEGSLSPLAEMINAAAERLATLQRDREDRLRLEGALAALTRAVEQAWLGQPWAWPASSGTSVDDLVALLYTPRPQDALTEAEHAEAERLRNDHRIQPQQSQPSRPSQPSQPSQPGAPSWPDGVSLETGIAHNGVMYSSHASVFDERHETGQIGASMETPGRFSPPSWEGFQEMADVSWPESWLTPLPDPTSDDLDESASRHITPPPQRRRWNE